MRYIYLVICLLVLNYGCSEGESKPESTFFAGEIVNPTAPHVVLFKGEEPVDTAFLDEKNRFSFQLESLEEGLYNFNHHPEFQYVYLEKGDSMQIRLNTVAFDESLVFSGEGEDINNFLIDLYLEGEKEEDMVRQQFMPLEPEVFAYKMDSITEYKLQELEALRLDSDISSTAIETAKASILYQNYFYREGYPFWHRKESGHRILDDLPEGFYAYRENVAYQDANLTFLKPYYDFMIYHIGNLAYMKCMKKCEGEVEEVSEKLHFNRHQLQLIDSLITEQELKDNLFRSVAFNYLLKQDTEANFRTFMEDLHQRSGNNRHLNEIENLHGNIKGLMPGKALPELPLESLDGQAVMLNAIPAKNEKVVFYFWSGPQIKHLQNIRQRIHQLESSETYKGCRFVGICLRTEQGRWKELVDQYSLDPDTQFWAEDFDTFAHTLIVYHPFKSIIVQDGKIENGFANLNASFK